ncbi:MAG: hypothetical protein HY308_10700 [Gammaproteobacteria bacterium]|nr:hypothetical protein [Gammaproteobacteria bacterium]
MPPRSNSRHSRSRPRGEEQKRLRITAEAARIMAEEGVDDYQTAKRKAATRLNITDQQHLPSNEEIEAALAQHLQLFHGPELARNTRRLREIALQAMRFLEAFEPRLVGSVLSGTVTPNAEVQLHVSADTPENIALFLGEHHIPFEQGKRRLRFGDERYENVSAFRFSADGTTIELCLFNSRAVREPPLSPVDGRPMRRANLREVELLLQR